MPKRGRNSEPTRRRAPPPSSTVPRGPRKKMVLDVLLEYETGNQLLKGYSNEQLTELHQKIFDLEKELSRALDLEGEVAEVVGAKMDNKVMWFYVKWEDGESSFVPASILNKTAPDKVIQYYESILQFQPSPDSKVPVPEQLPNKVKTEETKPSLPPVKDEKKNRLPDPPKIQQPPAPKPDITKPFGPAKGFRTMNCTSCSILLQYPEGTKAIKCPVCNAVMHAR